MDVLGGLNPAQREAVLIESGPLLILAGPGSGKTRVITHRIAHLVSDQGIAPWRILAVTFTNKAARELRERVQALLGDEAEGLALGTFHAICSRILRADGGAVGVDRGFTIYDDADQLALIKQAFVDLAIDPKRINQRAVLSTISRAKSELIGADEYGRARCRLLPGGRRPRLPRLSASVGREQGAGFRRPDHAHRRAASRLERRAREVRAALPPCTGGRVPGHQPCPVRADAAHRLAVTTTSASSAIRTSRSTRGGPPTCATS